MYITLEEFIYNSRYITALGAAISAVGTLCSHAMMIERYMTSLETVLIGIGTYACSSLYLTITDGMYDTKKSKMIITRSRELAFLLKKFSLGFASIHEASIIIFSQYTCINYMLNQFNSKYKYLMSAYTNIIATNLIFYLSLKPRFNSDIIDKTTLFTMYATIPALLLFTKYKSYLMKKNYKNTYKNCNAYDYYTHA